MANTTLEQWALPRLKPLLPLDDDSLIQVIQYADSLSRDAAAEHLKNLLGDDGRALEFIATFNLRRQSAPASTPTSSSATPTNHDRHAASSAPERRPEGVPRAGGGRGRGKKKANIHSLPARQVEGHGNVSGGYVKSREEVEYIPRSARQQQQQQQHSERLRHEDTVAANLALRSDATQRPLITDDASLTSQPVTARAPPSAAGPLVSDALASPRKQASAQSSRNASPAPKAKVNIAGGTAMHGAASTLSDLDSAIRSLEVQTNPTLSSSASSATENEKRKCNCMATRHPLLDIAPNCMHCGKIICVKQGLGPCTFCGNPLLTADEIAKVLRVLKDERGEERMKANNALHKKADVAHGKARAFTGRDFLAQASSSSNRSSPLSSTPATPEGSDDETGKKAAQQHRDKLLGFQANNARRTQIHDEAADYDIPTSGTNMWASPAERAQQLKRQQKVLREMQWNARPEYEKRRVVASIDLKGGKVVRRMAEVEKPDFESADEEVGEDEQDFVPPGGKGGKEGGAFSRNPLAKGLIKPIMRERGSADGREKRSMWRRVQMDEDDNEQWILDGGVYGGETKDRVLGAEEQAFG